MLPLAGVRILAVEQYGAGPFGSMQLADMGAEVIKIENPKDGGDVSRSVGPYFLGEHDSHFFQAFNRNKRSVTLNLRAPEGQRVLHDLAATADAVLDNLRGDQPPRLGVTYDQLKSVNPRIVCAHLSAYGREGSRAAWPGYDYLMQAEAGYLSLTGEPDQPPARFGLSDRRYDGGRLCRDRAAWRHRGSARIGCGARCRCQPVRHCAVQPELPGGVVSEWRPCTGP